MISDLGPTAVNEISYHTDSNSYILYINQLWFKRMFRELSAGLKSSQNGSLAMDGHDVALEGGGKMQRQKQKVGVCVRIYDD